MNFIKRAAARVAVGVLAVGAAAVAAPVGLWHKDRDAVTYSYGVRRDSVIAIP